MSLDRLLLWLSAKREGSWSQFRAAVEGLHVQQQAAAGNAVDEEGDRSPSETADLSVYQQVRFALQRLAHVEFFASRVENGWRVVPPAVAFPMVSADWGLVCGARSPGLLERLQNLGGVRVEVMQVEGMPQRILIRGSSEEEVTARVRRLGFRTQSAAPIAVLSATPGVCDSSTWFRSPMPETPGWAVHRFSATRLQWGEASQAGAATARAGLFRFVMRHQRFHYLRWRSCSYRVPVQVGKYAVMRSRRGILSYDSARRVLSAPVICRPPLLVERALVLCSGLLPQLDAAGRVEYTNVPVEVVQLAGQLLHQEVR